MRKPAATIALIVALTLTGAGAPAATDDNLVRRTVDRTVSSGASPTVVLKSFAGDVHVTTADAPNVVVHAFLKARDQTALDKMAVDVKTNGTTVEIAARPGDASESIFSRNRHGDRSIDFTVTVPKNASIAIDQFAGDITVAAPARGATVTERAGDVIISQVTGPVKASLLAGDLTVSLAPEWNGAAIEAHVRVGDLVLRAPQALRARAKAVAHANVTIGEVSGF